MCLQWLFRRPNRSASVPRTTSKPPREKQPLCSTADRRHATRRPKDHRSSVHRSYHDPDGTEPLLHEQRMSTRGSVSSREDRRRPSPTYTLRGYGVKRDPPKPKKPIGSGDREFRMHKKLPKRQEVERRNQASSQHNRGRGHSRQASSQSQQRQQANSGRRRDPAPRTYRVPANTPSGSSHHHSHRAAPPRPDTPSFAIRAATNRELERARREAQNVLHNYTQPRPSWLDQYYQPAGVSYSQNAAAYSYAPVAPSSSSRQHYSNHTSNPRPYSRRLDPR